MYVSIMDRGEHILMWSKAIEIFTETLEVFESGNITMLAVLLEKGTISLEFW